MTRTRSDRNSPTLSREGRGPWRMAKTRAGRSFEGPGSTGGADMDLPVGSIHGRRCAFAAKNRFTGRSVSPLGRKGKGQSASWRDNLVPSSPPR